MVEAKEGCVLLKSPRGINFVFETSLWMFYCEMHLDIPRWMLLSCKLHTSSGRRSSLFLAPLQQRHAASFYSCCGVSGKKKELGFKQPGKGSCTFHFIRRRLFVARALNYHGVVPDSNGGFFIPIKICKLFMPSNLTLRSRSWNDFSNWHLKVGTLKVILAQLNIFNFLLLTQHETSISKKLTLQIKKYTKVHYWRWTYFKLILSVESWNFFHCERFNRALSTF